jgi:translation initiation factor 2B subunit (eIF-2B alpha/beta/delta family)
VNSIQQAVEGLQGDRRSGASALSRRLAEALAEFAAQAPASTPDELLESLRGAARALAEARPSMLAMANTAGQIVAVAARPPLPTEVGELRARVTRAARGVLDVWEAAAQAVAGHASQLLPESVLTYSYSSTVLTVLLQRRPRQVVVPESRPLYEGRTLASELLAAGIPSTLITDAQVGYFMSSTGAVLVGADAVLADGAVINKAGTYLLALAAHRESVPFYVACESLKVCAETEEPSPPEEKEPHEVWPEAPNGLAVRNVYFERTPPDLVSAIITEEGALRPEELGPLVERARRYQRALKDTP